MSRVIAPFAQFFDASGQPLANGYLRFLISGTNNTDKNTYSDSSQTIPNANPLQLDAGGRCPNAFGQGVYRIDLFDYNAVTKSPGQLIGSFDPVTVLESGAIAADGHFAEWDAGVTYQVGDIVILNGDYYRSIVINNLGNTPDSSPAQWEQIEFLRYWNQYATYNADAIAVYGTQIYFSLAAGNINHQPDLSPAWWTGIASGTILLNWQESGTSFVPQVVGYELGSATNLIGGLYLGDTDPIYFGDSQDATIQFDGTNLVIATAGVITTANQIESSLVTGTAPFIIASTTLNSNLNADLLDGQEGAYYATDALTAHLAGSEIFTGQKTFDLDILLSSGAQIDFADENSDKLYLFSNTYGIGIEASYLTHWSADSFRWRSGGTSVSTGTERMALSSAGVLTIGTDLNLGPQTASDTVINFYDLNSAVYRSLKWVNASNDWYVEDNGGVDRLLTHAGNLSTDDTLAGDSDTTAVSESAVKGYVDTEVLAATVRTASFKNKLINGNFDFWQYATSQTSSGYGSDDRWYNFSSGSTKTHSRQSFTIGQTDVPGNPKYYSSTVFTAGAGVSDAIIKFQKIESVYTFAGETITLSFYANASTTLNLATEFAQNFGTGGSPSAVVNAIGVTTHNLTTSWQKFTVTTTLPSISGKTIGSNNDDRFEIYFWFDAGSNYDARTNTLGHQSGTINISEIQIESGTVATDFEDRAKEIELSLCLRYFRKSYPLDIAPGTALTTSAIKVGMDSATNCFTPIFFDMPMRTIPTLLYWDRAGNASRVTVGGVTDNVALTLGSISSSSEKHANCDFIIATYSNVKVEFHYSASAEL